MSYLVGSMETRSSGGMAPVLGQVTLTLPNVKAAADSWAQGYRELMPSVSRTQAVQPGVTDVVNAGSGGQLTEEQIRAMLNAGGGAAKPAGGFLESLPSWALPAGLAAVVGGFLLLRK